MENEETTTQPTTPVSEEKMTAEQIKAASDQEKLDRSNRASDKINMILKEENCNLTVPGFVITAN